MPAYPYIDESEAAEVEDARADISADLATLGEVERHLKAARAALTASGAPGSLQSRKLRRWLDDLEIALDEGIYWFESVRELRRDMDLVTAREAA